jgi:hypothetical protein
MQRKAAVGSHPVRPGPYNLWAIEPFVTRPRKIRQLARGNLSRPLDQEQHHRAVPGPRHFGEFA